MKSSGLLVGAWCLFAAMVLGAAGIWTTYENLSAPPPAPATREGFRYTVVFDNGLTYYSNSPQEFGYLDTMTCVYNGTKPNGKTFSRVCHPADIEVTYHDRFDDK